MAQRHTVHTLELDGASALVLGALQSGSHSVEYEETAPESGGPYKEVCFLQQIMEMIDAATMSLASVVDSLSLVQVTCIEAGQAYTSLSAYGRALDACGTDGTAAGSVHRRTRAAIAKLAVTRISVSGNGDAAVTLKGYLLSADGDADASIIVNNVALPASPIVDEVFKLHGVRVAGVTLAADHITQVTLDTGITITPEFGVKARPQTVTVTKTAPTLTIDTEDTSLVASGSFSVNGSLATHTNSLLEFRKRDPSDGGEVAPATAEHVRMTVAGLVKPPQLMSGSGSNKATAQLMVTLTGESGSPPIVPTSGVALTL